MPGAGIYPSDYTESQRAARQQAERDRMIGGMEHQHMTAEDAWERGQAQKMLDERGAAFSVPPRIPEEVPLERDWSEVDSTQEWKRTQYPNISRGLPTWTPKTFTTPGFFGSTFDTDSVPYTTDQWDKMAGLEPGYADPTYDETALIMGLYDLPALSRGLYQLGRHGVPAAAAKFRSTLDNIANDIGGGTKYLDDIPGPTPRRLGGPQSGAARAGTREADQARIGALADEERALAGMEWPSAGAEITKISDTVSLGPLDDAWHRGGIGPLADDIIDNMARRAEAAPASKGLFSDIAKGGNADELARAIRTQLSDDSQELLLLKKFDMEAAGTPMGPDDVAKYADELLQEEAKLASGNLGGQKADDLLKQYENIEDVPESGLQKLLDDIENPPPVDAEDAMLAPEVNNLGHIGDDGSMQPVFMSLLGRRLPPPSANSIIPAAVGGGTTIELIEAMSE